MSDETLCCACVLSVSRPGFLNVVPLEVIKKFGGHRTKLRKGVGHFGITELHNFYSVEYGFNNVISLLSSTRNGFKIKKRGDLRVYIVLTTLESIIEDWHPYTSCRNHTDKFLKADSDCTWIRVV